MSPTIIPDIQLIDNSEQRTPLVLVLDCSGSMAGEPIRHLNDGLRLLEWELKADVIASKRVQILLIKYGNNNEVEVAIEWLDATSFTAATLNANGYTPTGLAIETALSKIEEQKHCYKEVGISYTRPWVFLLSDGHPTDVSWERAAKKCREAEVNNKLLMFPIAVGEAVDINILGKFSSKGTGAVKRLDGLKFKELFLWLSASMKVVSQSRPGGMINLPSTDNWSCVEL